MKRGWAVVAPIVVAAVAACSAFGSSDSGTTPAPAPPPPPASGGDASSTDAAAEAGGPTSTRIACGQTSCTLPQICCQHQDGSLACTSVDACRKGGDLPYFCFDRTNCGSDQVCCVDIENVDVVASVSCLAPSACVPDAGIGSRYVACTPSATNPQCGACVPLESVRSNSAKQKLYVCQ